jgi:Tfp pilus assembly protein PilF
MVGLLDAIERASGLFVQERYRDAIPLFRKILAEDPYNLDATLRLATAYSMLKQDAAALGTFKQAARIAPQSPDVRTYLGLHYARGSQWELAVPLLERTVAESPERTAAVEALASLRVKQGRHADAIALWQKVYELRAPNAAELVRLGLTAMEVQHTSLALASLEKARTLDEAAFTHDLELGVLYLSARKPEEARTALDRVAASDPAYPMALFKRAQVSVLLNEEDRAERVARARRHADRTTRELIANEKLFEGMAPR